MGHRQGFSGMNTPPVVSQQEWEAAWQQMLGKEKAFTRARDKLAAERRRHSAWTPGGVGGLARGLPADAAVQVVELA
jgi:hypothetical protein